MIIDSAYKQVYPTNDKLIFKKKTIKFLYFDFHTNKTKQIINILNNKPTLDDIKIGKRIGVFAIIFAQVLNLKRGIFQLYNFVKPKLYYKLKIFLKAHKKILEKNKLFSDNIKLNRVIIQKHFIHKIYATCYITDNNQEKFFCFELLLDYKTNSWHIKNIEMLIGNKIKKFE